MQGAEKIPDFFPWKMSDVMSEGVRCEESDEGMSEGAFDSVYATSTLEGVFIELWSYHTLIGIFTMQFLNLS